jgi:lysophospholipase L1-like esterase
MVGHDTTVEHRTFVALGDSFTEGLEDDLGPAGRHLGWADRVAAALATREGGLRYANLAVRGRLLDQVVAEQVPAALALQPDLLSFHAGPNDVLRPGRDVGAVVRRYDAAVGDLVASGVQVLLFTVIERAGGTGRTAARLAERFAQFNAGVRRTARAPARWSSRWVPSRRCRTAGSGTRTGCTSRPAGHARVAAACWRRSGSPSPACSAASPAGGGSRWHPVSDPGRRADVLADVRWVRRYLAPWVGRRLRGASSGDGLSPKHLELVDVLPVEPDGSAGG